MVFNSMSELTAYVESKMDDCARKSAEKMLEIMRDTIIDAYLDYQTYYERTRQMLDTPQIIIANKQGITTEFVDNGDWVSAFGRTQGQHFFALAGWEKGTTLGRPATNVVAFSTVKCYSTIPDYYRKCLQSFGIPTI